VQQNLLDLHEFLEPRAAALPAETALLDPAEWLVGRHREHAVDRDAARFELGGDNVRARQVARVEIGAKPETAVVRHRDRIGIGVETDDRQNRAEHLLARKMAVVRDAGEDRRLDETSRGKIALAAAPAGYEPSAALRLC